MNNICYIMILSSLLFSCKNNQNSSKKPTSNDSQLINKSSSEDSLVLVNRNDTIDILYSEKNRTLYLNYNIENYNIRKIANISGWSGIAPMVELKKLKKDRWCIVVTVYSPGISEAEDWIYFYLFNTSTKTINEVCVAEGVGRHNRDNEDQFPLDIHFYDYLIDYKERIIIKEYIPYKSDEEKNRYRTKQKVLCEIK